MTMLQHCPCVWGFGKGPDPYERASKKTLALQGTCPLSSDRPFPSAQTMGDNTEMVLEYNYMQGCMELAYYVQ